MFANVLSSAGEAGQESGVRTHGRRVLLVDDNSDAAELLAELLQAYGHEVLVVTDAVGALAAAPAFGPDVALLDIGLPVIDGYELARRLRAVLPEAPFLIALTGYGREQDRAQAREAGFDEHLVKPVNPQHLLALIQQTLGARVAQA